MRVLYDHQAFVMQAYGGVSRYFHELITRAASSAEVDPFLFQGMHFNRYETARASGLRALGRLLPARARFPKSRVLYEAINASGLTLAARAWKPRIYHQTYYRNYLRRFNGVRVVTVLDMIHELFPEAFPPGDPTPELKREAVALADHVIAISAQTKNDLVRLVGVAPEKVSVVHLASSIDPLRMAVRQLDRPYFLYVGDRTRYKNYLALARAFAAVKLETDARLVCVGGAPWTAEETGLHDELGISDRVVRVPGAGDEVLASWYAHALAFVYPSKYEGFGIPLLEAMNCRCPVVAARAGSIPEIGGEAALYFDPSEVEELASILEKLATDSSAREAVIQRGLARAAEFSWDRTFRETLAVYSELCGSPGPRANKV